MADSGFSLKKLFGWLDGFLKSMSSPMSGWDMADVKVKQEGDNFSSYFSFTTEGALNDTRTGEQITNFKGEKIELAVLLKVINSQAVLSPIMSGLNNMSQNDTKAGKELLNVLFGEEAESDNQGQPTDDSQPTDDQSGEEQSDNGQPTDDQSSGDQTNPNPTDSAINVSNNLQSIFASDFTRAETATKNGTGLLGADLEKVSSTKDLPKDSYSFDNKEWSWDKLAYEYLQYAIECQVPGKNYGAIENVSLENCADLISEYLVHEDCIADASEVKIDSSVLVLPILCRMKAMLAEYFENAYKNNPGIQEVEDAVYKAEAPKKEPQTVAYFDQDGVLVGHVDVSTPEGKAQLEELKNQGYSVMESKKINVKLKKIKICASSGVDFLF